MRPAHGFCVRGTQTLLTSAAAIQGWMCRCDLRIFAALAMTAETSIALPTC